MPQLGSFVGGSSGSLITNLLAETNMGSVQLMSRAVIDGLVQTVFSNLAGELFPTLTGIQGLILTYYKNVYTIGGGSIISPLILDFIFNTIFGSSDECEAY